MSSYLRANIFVTLKLGTTIDLKIDNTLENNFLFTTIFLTSTCTVDIERS